MTTFTSTTAVSMDDLWPSNEGVNIEDVLTNNQTTYWIRLYNGAHIRYTSTNNDFADFIANNHGVLVPLAGTYSLIELTDASGNVLGTLNNFGNQLASDITGGFNNVSPFGNVMGGDDIIGNIVSNGVYRGGNGSDIFSVQTFQSGTPPATIAAAVIDGGDGNDTLEIRQALTVGGTTNFADLRTSTISSIEQIQFTNSTGAGEGGSNGHIRLNSDQFGNGQVAQNLNLIGSGLGSATLQIYATTGGTLDYSQFTFQNWGVSGSSSEYVIYYANPGVSAVDWVGTVEKDIFYLRGIDSVFGGGGDDRFNFDNTFTASGAQYYNGGSGTDTLTLNASGTFDFRLATLTSIERLSFKQAGSVAQFTAEQIGSGLSSTAIISRSGGNGSLTIDMANSNSLNLSGFTFQGNATDIIINGDADAETITGSTARDVIYGNGGNDILDGNVGNDTLVGGDGSDTYFADLETDDIQENNTNLATGGNDLVYFTGTFGTFVLSANVERLTLLGSGNTNGTGNELANTIVGNSGNNILLGGDGDDTIIGGLGADIMDGGAGNPYW